MHRRLIPLAVLLGLIFSMFSPGPFTGTASAAQSPNENPDPIIDARSTSGPRPAEDVVIPEASPAGPEAVVIPGVPAYLWRHGCGPTAAGMIIGYWDSQGYDWLVPGDASTQTQAVNEMMASSIAPGSHLFDYAQPVDHAPGPLLPDRSEEPFGDEHPADSLADFMRTSWSSRGNYYGWSWFSDFGPALEGYVNLVKPDGYSVATENLVMGSTLTWESYKAEIDAGRPMALLVDTEGDGVTDHFITAIGYDDSTGVRRYAAYDTWNRQVHWYDFRQLGKGIQWGIFGAITFRIDPPVPEETLNICLVEEPASLYLYSEKLDFSAGLVLSALYGVPVDPLAQDQAPEILQELPGFENGLARMRTVQAQAGDLIVDASGEVVALGPGVVYTPAGCDTAACAQAYTGGAAELEQVQVTYPLLPGLSWSDGQPLTAADSVFSFQLSADPGTPPVLLVKKAVVERTQSYTASGDTTVVWTGLPGYRPADLRQTFWMPLPEHSLDALSAVGKPVDELEPELPLGWGPYRIVSWEPGVAILMVKNPLYFRQAEGLPYFDELVFHFSLDPLEGLLSGQCDISPDLEADLDTLRAYDLEGLLKLMPVQQMEQVFPAGSRAAEGNALVSAVAPPISYPALDSGGWLLWDIEQLRVGVEAAIPVGGGELFSSDDGTAYRFAAGAFTASARLTHIPLSPAVLPSPGALVGIGHYFENRVQGIMPAVPSRPYSLEIHYSTEELGTVRESSLALYYWDGANWKLEPTSQVDTGQDVLRASPERFGLWAVLGSAPSAGHSLFLPQLGGG